MAASRQFNIPGFDPTGDPDTCVTPAQLLQMVNASYLMPDLGGFVWSDTAPDTILHPELAKYVWMETVSDVPTGNMFYYTGTSWAQLVQPIPDNSIGLSKLTLTGTSPYVIIQMNSAGTAWSFVSPPNAIQNGTLPLAKLISSTNGKFIYYTGGAWQAITLDNAFLNTIITALAVANLAPGTPGQVLMTNAGPTVAWGTFSTGLPVITGVGDALKLIQVNAAGAAYELIARTAVTITPAQISGGTNGNFMQFLGGSWQGSGNAVSFTVNPAPSVAGPNTPAAHGLGGLPDAASWSLECITTDAGYAVGDRVDIHCVWSVSGTNDHVLYTPVVSATQVTIVTDVNVAGAVVANKSTGTPGTFTPSKWKIVGGLVKL